jgi:glycosyltransferase involved in cell wall biosynthesis
MVPRKQRATGLNFLVREMCVEGWGNAASLLPAAGAWLLGCGAAMKILILFSHKWRGGRSGGAETHALQLMKELSARGHEIYFVASSGDEDDAAKPRETKPEGVVAEYRLRFQSLNPFDKIAAYKKLLEIVERHGIEIIHAHHRTGGYFAECIYRRCGVPYVITVHDIWHQAPAKALHGRIFRHLIAVSGFIKKGLVEKFGIAPEQVRVIHNGVDAKLIEKASNEDAVLFRQRFGIGNEVVVFSLVARITKSKGHYDVVEALRRVPRDLNYRCLIVGEGKDKEKLQKLVAEYGLGEKVVFCGFQSNIPAVMRASDVILLPSHREPFAITILEAMFSRRPLLVSDSGGTPEAVVNECEGIAFPVRDVAALAAGIERLIRDEDLRRRLGERAYRTAHGRFLLEKMIADTEAYYASIVQTTKARLTTVV